MRRRYRILAVRGRYAVAHASSDRAGEYRVIVTATHRTIGRPMYGRLTALDLASALADDEKKETR